MINNAYAKDECFVFVLNDENFGMFGNSVPAPNPSNIDMLWTLEALEAEVR